LRPVSTDCPRTFSLARCARHKTSPRLSTGV
jgi:hypothetical protein